MVRPDVLILYLLGHSVRRSLNLVSIVTCFLFRRIYTDPYNEVVAYHLTIKQLFRVRQFYNFVHTSSLVVV